MAQRMTKDDFLDFLNLPKHVLDAKGISWIFERIYSPQPKFHLDTMCLHETVTLNTASHSSHYHVRKIGLSLRLDLEYGLLYVYDVGSEYITENH